MGGGAGGRLGGGAYDEYDGDGDGGDYYCEDADSPSSLDGE